MNKTLKGIVKQIHDKLMKTQNKVSNLCIDLKYIRTWNGNSVTVISFSLQGLTKYILLILFSEITSKMFAKLLRTKCENSSK